MTNQMIIQYNYDATASDEGHSNYVWATLPNCFQINSNSFTSKQAINI